MPARTDRATRAERMVFMIILLDLYPSFQYRAFVAHDVHMAHSALLKSCSHAPVTNSETTRGARDPPGRKFTEKVMGRCASRGRARSQPHRQGHRAPCSRGSL